MRFVLSVIVAFGLLSLVPRQLPAQEGSGTLKENLDLPYDARGEEEEEEDAPEIVTFYGTQLEGDGIFYCVDRSSSMGDKGEIQIAKRELVRNITEFSERVQFGIVFFDAGLTKFPPSGQPAESNPGMKASAIGYVNTIQAGSGSCCQQGLMQCLAMANRATSKRKVMVYLGDGRGHCQGGNEDSYLLTTLAMVSSANYQRIQINCIMVLDVTPTGEDFLRRLAAANGGNYTVKTR
jgi:Mg-chelatase subunit ChlD